MWNQKSDILRLYAFIKKAIRPDNQIEQDLYIWYYWFALFIAAFLNHAFSYFVFMPKVEIINCKTKDLALVYTFALALASKSTMARNISIFKDLNIYQLGLKKNALR